MEWIYYIYMNLLDNINVLVFVQQTLTLAQSKLFRDIKLYFKLIDWVNSINWNNYDESNEQSYWSAKKYCICIDKT
jgi:hypothetical protein